MAGNVWSEKELEFLKANFQEKSCAEIAKELGRTVRSVQHKFGQLKLERETLKVSEYLTF